MWFWRLNRMTNSRPQSGEYADYYHGYIQRVPEGNIVQILQDQLGPIDKGLSQIDETQASQLHEPYTWTIKQVVGHLIDAERVFAYRALRFASADSQPIPGMDQNEWVDNNDYENPTLKSLKDELLTIRQGNVLMFGRFAAECWDRTGTVEGNPMSVRALAFCMAGHVPHHLEIIKSRISD